MAANATAIWRVRPSGSNTNGGGYDSGIASAGTDWSQQNAAHKTNVGVTTTATVTLTDAGASFSGPDLIGNAIRVAGTGIATTYTFITAVPSGTTLTLQTSPGTTGTSVTYSIGGGWADFWTNTTSAAAIIVPGNTVYILGSGTPSPASYTYDYSYAGSGFTSASGNLTAGRITYANDPGTPGYKAPPDTTGGMPCTKMSSSVASYTGTINGNLISLEGLWFVQNSTTTNVSQAVITSGNSVGRPNTVYGCVLDQFGITTMIGDIGYEAFVCIGCEVFSSQAASVTGGLGAVFLLQNNGTGTSVVLGCNIHDTVDYGVYVYGSTPTGASITNNIIAKNGSNGITVASNTTAIDNCLLIANNTIDGNVGHGIDIVASQSVALSTILNNIISNQTGVGKYGINCESGSATINASLAPLIDYNVYYNNTADLNHLNYGPHDTHGGSNPYVGQSTENYTLA